MTKNARLLTGITLLIILAFNYGIIGFPLIRKAMSLNDKATTMMMAKIKAGHALRTSGEEDYILDVFRREKESITRKLIVLNAVSLTVVIVIISWTLFGLVIRRTK